MAVKKIEEKDNQQIDFSLSKEETVSIELANTDLNKYLKEVDAPMSSKDIHTAFTIHDHYMGQRIGDGETDIKTSFSTCEVIYHAVSNKLLTLPTIYSE